MSSLQLYPVADPSRNQTVKFDSAVRYARIDYKMRKIMVSLDNKVAIVDNGDIVEVYSPPFSEFHYIFPLYETYFITTYGGMLYWSNSHKF